MVTPDESSRSPTAGDLIPNVSDGSGFTIQQEEPQIHSRWNYVLIVLAAFMINFTVGGLLFGFGIYQALYETMTSEQSTPFSGASSAEIDLIGTLSISVMTIGAPFAVAWTKYLSPQAVVCAGGVVFGLANVLASFGLALWHFQLAQGLLLGIGTCLSFIPSMAVAPTWFEARRGLAIGIASAGTGIGGLVWAPVLTACIEKMGFRNTLRLTGALSAGLICAAGSILRWEPSMGTRLRAENATIARVQRLFRIPLPGWHIATQRKFIAQALGAALQSAAYYTPVFFLASYAETLGYNEKDGANFTAVSNACNAIGKISVGLVADRIGRLNSFFLTTFLSAAVTVGLWIPSALIGTTNETVARQLFISFTVLYGIFASAYVSLFPAALVELFGLKQLPQVTGLMYMAQGIGAMVGTPVAGVLVRGNGTEGTSSNYAGMAILVGALLFATAGTVAWVRFEVVMSSNAEGRKKWKL